MQVASRAIKISSNGIKKKRSLWNLDALFSARVKQTAVANTIAFNSRKCAPWNSFAPLCRPEGSPEEEEEDGGEGKLAKGNPRREGSPRPSTSSSLHHYHHPLLVLDVSPRRLFRRSRVRDGDLRNHAFVRFVPLARAESIGVFRDAQRSPQASASELGKEDASHRRVLLRGEVSWGNPAWLSSLSPLTFASFNVANDARLSSLIFRVALHRDNHLRTSNKISEFGIDSINFVSYKDALIRRCAI